MPHLVDTTVRLLSQEPLAGKVPTGEVLRIAEILDGAGFACLEVSGGGVFDAAVRRGVESPWERIRAIDARTTTPLGIALRGRFLVGSKPVSTDIVRRFVACAAENGVDVFRLHDPLNDVSNLREAGESIVGAGGKPCPPGIVGIGIGGSADYAMHLAKEAIARPVGSRNPDPVVAQLEDELYELLNETGIGPMGLGGDVTVLQCHIEHADTHMTLNPVAVNYQCWAARRASAHVARDGTVVYDREA